MLRVTTLYACSASATARYYTRYLTDAEGEEPGVWMGGQAAGLGLTGEVSTEALEALLSGRDPTSGTTLGYPLRDRTSSNGALIRAVAGFDATLSAPKSLSVSWAVTGDPGLADCHDIAVSAVVECLERFGSTTRIRSHGARLHPDTQGLTIAAFRQTTSRLDDPQLHTHLVISAKVQTDDGRWLALDARVLKHFQRALGGLYQSVLRAELTHHYGVDFGEIVNGQAEIAGVPTELLEVFSKRAGQVAAELDVKLDGFRERQGRQPTRFERAALEREAAADTRRHKSGHGVGDLRSRWLAEAAEVGVTADSLWHSIAESRPASPATSVTVGHVIGELSVARSAWHRLDVLQAVTDWLRPEPGMSGERWTKLIDRAVDQVLESCIDLDPSNDTARRRMSDGRSIWIEPAAAQVTSAAVIAQEEAILSWVLDTQIAESQTSTTVVRRGLDVLQADAAAAVAGWDRLVVVVGPAGAGKTTMLRAAVTDLCGHGRGVFGVAPTAKAARVLERETGMPADTVAKLLYEWSQPDGPRPPWRLTAGCTVVVDEAGMLATCDLHRLVELAEHQHWRLALVGDPRQLQAVARGGMFAEIVTSARTIELEHIHRFHNPWEAAASLQLRHGDLRALDAYQAYGRIIPGALDDHLDTIANYWMRRHQAGQTVAITTTTNDHVDTINGRIQTHRYEHGQLDTSRRAIAADGPVFVGDVIATRRNDRHLHTDTGDTVRNRELWTVAGIHESGELTVTRCDGHGRITLPGCYVDEHVRLGYAATEPGNQADTKIASITLATPATTGRGLYVAMTRGQDENVVLVVTDTNDIGEARDILEAILTSDRADTPAVTHRRQLAEQDRHTPRPQPRCDIPEWFNALDRQARHDLQEVRTETDEAHHRRQSLVSAVAAAEDKVAELEQTCRPHVERLNAANVTLAAAEADWRAAEHAVDQSKLGHRRHARADLADANARVATARTEVELTELHGHRSISAWTDAGQQLKRARASLRDHDRIEQWSSVPERLDAAQQLVASLATWQDWANGRPITSDQVITTLDQFDQHAASPYSANVQLLSAVMSRWAQHSGIEVEARRPGPPSRGIELDIEI